MRTITALYDTMAEAAAARGQLVTSGIADAAIDIIDQSRMTAPAGTTSGTDDPGFFGSIRNLFIPDEDRYTYAEGVRRGGALLTVEVEADEADRVVTLLDSSGSVDIDTREATWRKEGWQGYDASALGSSGSVDQPGRVSAGLVTDKVAGDERIELIEERLRVGKREVERGGVRVRSYVVETPISETVSLRNETVKLERRPVDRAVGVADGDAFRERSFEMTERDEEAVIAKEVRVKEELVLSKGVEQREETVSDTVRRTEVEVEDTRTQHGLTKERKVGGANERELAGAVRKPGAR